MPVRRGRHRIVLAMLLLNAGRVVSADQLAEALWGQELPPSTRVTTRNYVMRLRQALGDVAADRIRTRPPGYLIDVNPGELDTSRFEALLTSARTAARSGSWDTAASQAGAALALWRGDPLADVESETLILREVPRLTELRLQAWETLIEADLLRERQGEAIAELERLVAAHPLREHLQALLMLALYRSGRQADALSTYRRAREVLVEELGAEPGAELRELHQRILAGEPAMLMTQLQSGRREASEAPRADKQTAATSRRRAETGSAALRTTPAWPGASPRQLPPPLANFVGRAAELDELTALLNSRAAAHGTMIAAIGGAAGVGKTALTVYWAHRTAGSFPDGQLYLNLNGFGPAGLPVTQEDAVGRMLEAMQVPPTRIPASFEGRAALYRTLLAERRTLVVLDNARDAEQVRPLLPGGAGSLVLVTSRSPLADLVAIEGARPIALSVLTKPEARQMIAQRLGQERTTADPAVTDQLIDACAQLPLALAIATALIATRPARSLTTAVSSLRHASDRLNAFNTGEATSNLRAVFHGSYQALSPDAARMFRLLAEHPGPDISIAAAASLAGQPVSRASGALTELSDLHLIDKGAPGRYTLHDLLRLYAAEMLSASDSLAGRLAAGGRMLDHYLHTAWSAAHAISPTRNTLNLEPADPGAIPEDLADSDAGTNWLKTEHHVLMRVIAYCADHGFDVHAWQLPSALTDYLDRGGHWSDYAASQRTALAAAERLADVTAQASAHRYIGRACFQLQELDDAFHHLTQAIELRHQLGEPAAEAGAIFDLCQIHEQRGDYAEALDCTQRALSLYRLASNRLGEAHALNAVGYYQGLLGDYAKALDHCGQALQLCEELGYQVGEGHTWHSLGSIRQQMNQPEQAINCFTRALDLYRQLKYRYQESEALTGIGDAHHSAGNTAAAWQAWQDALAILDDLGHPAGDQLRARITPACQAT